MPISLDFPLPEKGDNLFIAPTNRDSHFTVNPLKFAGMEGVWYSYIDGYKRAAELLGREAKKEFARDELLYPAIYLYRHALELALKHLALYSSSLPDSTRAVGPRDIVGHKLDHLWGIVKDNCKAISYPLETDSIAVFEECLTQLSQHDPLSYAWRYPINKKGIPTLDGLESVDLDNFMTVAHRLNNVLETIRIAIDLEFEALSDMGDDYYTTGDY